MRGRSLKMSIGHKHCVAQGQHPSRLLRTCQKHVPMHISERFGGRVAWLAKLAVVFSPHESIYKYRAPWIIFFFPTSLGEARCHPSGALLPGPSSGPWLAEVLRA